jgi:ABC-2 type transport system permease protein
MRRRLGVQGASAAVRVATLAAAVLVPLALNASPGAGRPARAERTISESSRATLAGLSDVVTVTVYMSENLPANMERFRTRLREILDEYRSGAGGRLRVSFVDPASDPEIGRAAALLGIRPIRVQAPEVAGVGTADIVIGIDVRCRDRNEVIPLLVSIDRLEYDLTLSILKVATRGLPRVGFLAGHGEHSTAGDYRTVASELSGSYEIREVDLSADPGALTGVATLVVPGARHVPDAQLFEIDQFIMRGGRAMFLLDGAEIKRETLRALPTQGNIFDFVSSYGATAKADLVVDSTNSNVTFRIGATTRSLPYPYWPKAIPPGLSRESPIVSGLEVIAFPWTSSITLADTLPRGVEATALARSSGRSWSVPALADLSPEQRFAPPADTAADTPAGRGSGAMLAVALAGEFPSAFSGKPVLVERGDHVEFTEPEGALERSARTRIIIVGNSRMFEDGVLELLEGSAAFFENAVDWLTFGDVLAGIGTPAAERRPAAPPPDETKVPVKLLVALGVLTAVAALGLAGAIARRRARRLP